MYYYNRSIFCYILYFVAFCILLSSCTKFLDKKQDLTAVIPSSLPDLQALMDAGAMIGLGTPALGEASSDEYYMDDDVLNSFTKEALDLYSWTPVVAGENSPNDWHNSYVPVYYSNLALDLLTKIKVNSSNSNDWNNVKGSALFYRSYYFLGLLWQYAKAYDQNTAKTDYGIVLRMSSDFNIPSKRATCEASYLQVIKDVKAAIVLLPDFPQVPTRPSKGAGYGLMARCYLSMRDYKHALSYADSALGLNRKLIDFNDIKDIRGDEVNDVNINPFKRYNEETIFYSLLSVDYDVLIGSGNVDTTLLSLYNKYDLRKNFYYGEKGSGEVYKGSYSGDTYYRFTGIATDELYLIRAECLVRNGEVSKGLDVLNTLLQNRYITGHFVPFINLSQSEALAAVLRERRKELYCRGNRWSDIKRLNKEGAGIVLRRKVNGVEYKLEPDANFYAIPIPDDIIKITGIPQNEP